MNILGISAFYHDSAAALVQDGDIIDIDIPNRRLNICVSESELDERKSKWKPKSPRVQGGFLDIYRRLVSGADEGAVLR